MTGRHRYFHFGMKFILFCAEKTMQRPRKPPTRRKAAPKKAVSRVTARKTIPRKRAPVRKPQRRNSAFGVDLDFPKRYYKPKAGGINYGNPPPWAHTAPWNRGPSRTPELPTINLQFNPDARDAREEYSIRDELREIPVYNYPEPPQVYQAPPVQQNYPPIVPVPVEPIPQSLYRKAMSGRGKKSSAWNKFCSQHAHDKKYSNLTFGQKSKALAKAYRQRA